MTSKYYHVTGVHTSVQPAKVPVRKEFNDFVQDTDVFNLYVLALARIQNFDQNELTSHFQIGGIHGLPYRPWDNVTGITDAKFGGYCTHGSVLFPTWHRPYVSLYEQVIWTEASDIANSYKDPQLKNKYKAAVERLRQPYWDWALNTIHPVLNSQQEVTVVTAPDGKSESIRNPLISYKFHPIDPSFTDMFAVWTQTLRHPTPATSADAKTDPAAVKAAMDSNRDQLRDNLYDLLWFVHDWTNMSNHTTSDGNNLEAIHDTVHGLVGRAGHMGSIPMAGFDPIFFLHHANVDRILALWQALNPSIWVAAGSSEDGSFTVPPGQTVNASTDLTPFHVNDDTYWTSDASRDTKAFGYTYPEISDASASPEELKEIVTQTVMKLYGYSFDISDVVSSGDAATKLVQETSLSAGNPSNNPGEGDPDHSDRAVSGPRRPSYNYNDWLIRVSVKPAEFQKSGFIHIFLSDNVPSGDWMFAPERVGDVTIFKNTSAECANCNQQTAAGATTTGQVCLTSALLKKGKNLNDVEGIKEYLKTNMHWRCAHVDGTEVPLENVPSLQVKACSALVERADHRGGSEGFPKRHAPQVHRTVTHGRLGGYAQESA